MPKTLDQLQKSVVLGEAELNRVAQMFQVVTTAVYSTKGQLLVERQRMAERKLMEGELVIFHNREQDCSLSREEVKHRSIQLVHTHRPKWKVQKSSKKT